MQNHTNHGTSVSGDTTMFGILWHSTPIRPMGGNSGMPLNGVAVGRGSTMASQHNVPEPHCAGPMTGTYAYAMEARAAKAKVSFASIFEVE